MFNSVLQDDFLNVFQRGFYANKLYIFIITIGDVSLTILKQPEQQHRARYQTEGSRGAVKDREGNGFPVVRLTGYYKSTTLQVSSHFTSLI